MTFRHLHQHEGRLTVYHSPVPTPVLSPCAAVYRYWQRRGLALMLLAFPTFCGIRAATEHRLVRRRIQLYIPRRKKEEEEEEEEEEEVKESAPQQPPRHAAATRCAPGTTEHFVESRACSSVETPRKGVRYVFAAVADIACSCS